MAMIQLMVYEKPEETAKAGKIQVLGDRIGGYPKALIQRQIFTK